MREKCPKCRGTGRDLHCGWLVCSRCGGDGYVGSKEIECPRCRGFGKSVPDGIGNTRLMKCERCGGTGHI